MNYPPVNNDKKFSTQLDYSVKREHDKENLAMKLEQNCMPLNRSHAHK